MCRLELKGVAGGLAFAMLTFQRGSMDDRGIEHGAMIWLGTVLIQGCEKSSPSKLTLRPWWGCTAGHVGVRKHCALHMKLYARRLRPCAPRCRRARLESF